ncbi:MAG: carboxypeptidase-like regulatory domain-containing protein [Candidatus Bathyarchaeota archaeon]|nr:carboxypeptidase-like regulatory domain-containing protein [Candidatus Bathyarchaeota archaeon]
MGGAKHDLYLVISGWSGFNSATIRVGGTNSDGASQNEDTVVNGNGTYYLAKYFKTATVSRVTAVVGSGSFDYSVVQGQWGVVGSGGVWGGVPNYQWVIGENQATRLQIGDGSTPTFFKTLREEIIVNALGLSSWGIYVTTNATFQAGYATNESTKATSGGSMLYIRCTDSFSPSLPLIYNSGTCYLYSTKIRGHTNLNVGLNSYGVLRVWNSQFDVTRQVIWGAGADVDWFNVVCSSAEKFAEGYGGEVDNVTIISATYGTCFSYGYGTTMKNLFGRNLSYAAQLYSFSGMANLVNASFDSWNFSWQGTIYPQGRINRQYEFDLCVTDKNNTPIESATVEIFDKDGNLVFSAVTDENGNIPTQTITRGYYQQSTGNTLQDLAPHVLTICKMGYQTYVKKFVPYEKTRWAVKVTRAQVVLFDSGSGRLVLNLRSAKPENNLVLSL